MEASIARTKANMESPAKHRHRPEWCISLVDIGRGGMLSTVFKRPFEISPDQVG